MTRDNFTQTSRAENASHTAAQERAIAAFQSGDFATAAALLVSLLACVPADPLLLRLCGMALVRTGAIGRGLPYLARARRLRPDDPTASLWLGIALHAAERFNEAASTLEAAVALAPADPAPLVHLARTWLKLGRPDNAADAARRARSLSPSLLEAQHALCLSEISLLMQEHDAPAPRLSDAWLDLGMVCSRLGNVADARHALQEALALQPSNSTAEASLAIIEHLCGEPLGAIARLRDLLTKDPDCLIARLHLASRLTLDNDPAGAVALLQGPTPDGSLRPHWQAQRIDALIRLRRHDEARAELALVVPPEADAEILLCWQRFLLAHESGGPAQAETHADRAAALALDPKAASLDHRIQTHFRLAELRRAQARHRPAFEHWSRGHALLRLAQPFSRPEHKAFLDRIIAQFDRDRLTNGPRASIRDPAPVFIVGLPRTGTTLTEHVLSAHPCVHGAGERLAIRETARLLTGFDNPQQALIRAASLDEPALTSAASAYLSALHALAPDAARVIDKMPDNFTHLGFVATLLPGARIICCTRDLRDVGASIFQHGFLGYHPYAHDLADLGWYMAKHQRLLQHWRASLTLPVLEVDHADWISNFDATLRRVLDFLELPYDAACARFHQQDRAVGTASRSQVNQPINSRGVGRWQTYKAGLEPMLHELPLALPTSA